MKTFDNKAKMSFKKCTQISKKFEKSMIKMKLIIRQNCRPENAIEKYNYNFELIRIH